MAVYAKDSSVEQIYKDLGKVEGKKEKLFETMKDVYMLALVLGAVNEDRRKLKKKSQDSIKEEIFGQENKRIMDFIALYFNKDINILNKSEESEAFIHNLVEEYANGGIFVLDELINSEYDDLDNLIAGVKEYEKLDNEPKKIDFADLLFAIKNEK